MSRFDKLLGYRDGAPIFGAYRIDYDSPDDVRPALDADFQGTHAALSPPPGTPTSDVKSGYQRKVVVDSATLRDMVQTHLTNQGIAHTTEDIAPTADEQDLITSHNPMNEAAAAELLAWDDALAAASSVAELREVRRGTNPSTGESITPREEIPTN